ncbi:MAG: efflux RND transporter periplasmic adaptor subunit, partial [Deltaproteobacteria bacterium]|nr:efflux RND transporter periplasmic adaptor subunit [Deltaproteobacteria bacterium]
MKSSHSFLLTLLIVASFGCDKLASDPASPTEKPELPANIIELSAQALENAELEIAVAGPGTIQQSLRIQGDVKLETERVASIVARVKGVVKKVMKKMGDQVKKGEALVTIDSKELAEAKMAYLETEHKIEFSKKALKRETQLLAKKITSKEAFLEKEHAVEEAEIAHASALQKLKVLGFSERSLHQFQDDLERNMTRFSLRAPFAGEIIKKNVTLGEALEEEKEVFVVADLSRVWVEAKVPVAKVGGLEKGQKVQVFSDKTAKKIEGELVYIASLADEASRTVLVRVEIDNGKGAWRPGMCARLDFPSQALKAPVTVPASAVHELEGR